MKLRVELCTKWFQIHVILYNARTTSNELKRKTNLKRMWNDDDMYGVCNLLRHLVKRHAYVTQYTKVVTLPMMLLLVIVI